MPEPTHDDAALFLKLLEITQLPTHSEARRWVLTEFSAGSHGELDSKYPSGSPERAHLTNVLGFFESAGVLVSRGLLHEDVFFDAPFAFDGLWPKIGPLLDDWQKQAGDPAIWENVAWLGLRYEQWRENRWRPKLEMAPPDKAPQRGEPTVRGFQH
jgi:hypothetical protein